MGNYYEGELRFSLDPKKIDSDRVIEILDKGGFTEEFNLTVNDLYKEAKGCAQYDKWTSSEDFMDTECNSVEVTDEEIGTYKNYLYEQGYKDFITIEITICSKHFLEDGKDKRIEELISLLTDYRLEEEIIVGIVKDEDYTYRREFCWNEEEHNRMIESRKFLCENCPENTFSKCLCRFWGLCERAYHIGEENGVATIDPDVVLERK